LLDSIPKSYSNKLPRHPVPTAHIARLGVDRNHQDQGLGALLLADALKRIRSISAQIGMHAVTVQALDPTVCQFYQAFGFIRFENQTSRLFLPIKTIR
jgi:GNAT superfamily N-acetyltransferase